MPFLIWSLVIIIKSSLAIETERLVTSTQKPEVFTYLPQPIEELLSQFLKENRNNSNIDQDFKDRLYQVALDVATLHRKGRSFASATPPYAFSIPRLPLDPQLMHAYTLGSGVSNREDTFVTRIREEPLYGDINGVSGWRYVRFNHTNYLLAILNRHLVIWKSNLDGKIPFDLRIQSAFAVLNTDSVIDCAFYISRRDKSEYLHLVAATYREAHSIFQIFAFVNNKIIPVTQFKLEDPVSKISYSSLGGKDTFLVLRAAPFPQDATVLTQDEGGFQITKFWVSYPVDMVSFIFNGRRFVVVANDTVCDVFVSRNFVDKPNFSIFDRLYLKDIVDVETFKIGRHVYLILAGTYEQVIFQMSDNGLITKQQFSMAGVSQMSVFYSSSCRDDVALLVLNENLHEAASIFSWRSLQQYFEPIPAGILPQSFLPAVGSVVSFFRDQTAYLVTVSRDDRQARVFSLTGETRALANPTIVKSNVMSDIMEKVEARLQKYQNDAQFYRHVLSKAVKAHRRVSSNHVLTSLVAELPLSVIKAGRLTENGNPVHWENSASAKEDFERGLIELRRHLQALENELASLERQLNDAVPRDSPSVITGHKTIHGLVSSPLLKFASLNMPAVGNVDVKKALETVLRLNRPQTRLGNIVVKGNLRVIGNLDTSSFNGLNLLHDVLLTSVPQEYKGKATFESPLKVRGNLRVGGDGRLGGVDLSQVIPLTEERVFDVPLHFSSPLKVRDFTTPVIDGVDVHQLIENTLRITHEQTLEIAPPTNFPTPFSNLRVTGLVNGVDLKSLSDRLVRANRPTKMNHLTLRDAEFDGGLFVKGRYDGLRFPESLFIRSASEPATISAAKSFSTVSFKDLVYVEGMCDGLKLPEGVVTLSKNERLTFPLHFQNGFAVENDLSVSGLVDGVDLNDLLARASLLTAESAKGVNAVFYGTVVVERHFEVSPSASAVDLEAIRSDLIFPEDRSIEITGQKHLSRLMVPSVDLKGMLNGYNIHEDFLHLRKDQVIKGKKVFQGPLTFSRNLGTGKNMVDGVNIVELYHNRVNLRNNSIIPGSLMCPDTVSVDQLLAVAGTLDGLKFPADFVFRDAVDEQTIVGKRFLKGVKAKEILLEGDLIVANLLDGVPINDFLRRRVTLSTSQALSSTFSLGVGNDADRLDSVFINGKDASSLATDYVSLTSPQTIFGNIFTWFGDTNALGDITTTNGINGYKMDELKNRVMKLNPFEDLSYALTFPDGLSVQGNLEARKFNGLDFNSLYREAVRKSLGGNLLGVNKFLSDVYVEGNLDAGLVNGMILRDELFLKIGDQTIRGSYAFDRIDVSGNFNPLGSVNGLDVSTLDHSLLKRNANNVVNGNLHFEQILDVSGDLDVRGLLNGVDLQALIKEAVWHRGMGIEQVVTGAKTITGPVTIDGDFLVGLVNGVDLSAALADMAFVNRDADITGPKTFAQTLSVPNGIVSVPGNLMVVGLVSGINLDELTNHFAFVDQPVIIQGLTVFEQSSIFDGTIVIRGQINGVNWPEDVIVLYTDEPQIISGVKIFDQLSVASHLNVDGLVNHRYHLPSLVMDTFSVHGEQTITGHKSVEGMVIFDDDVYGRVNRLNLVEETVHLDQPGQVIFDGRIIFDGALVVRGNLTANGRVCQVDLPDLASHAVYTDRDQVIEGDLVFQDVTVHDVLVDGRVAGLDLTSFHDDVLKLRHEADQATDQLVRHNREIDRAVSYLENVASRSGTYLDHVHLYQGLNFSGYPVETGSDRFRLVHSANETTVTTYVMDASGRFMAETVETSLLLLITTVQMGARSFSLWSDVRGHGILSEGPLYLANYSGFIHGDLRAVTGDILLVAILRKDSCDLIEMMVNPSGPGLVEAPTVVIESLQDPVSVHILKTSTKIYVAIDVSALTYTRDACVRDPNSALLIYIWNLASKSAAFFQRLDAASKHLAAFEKHGVHYLAKSDANSGNRNPKTEIKFYRRDDRFNQKFEYSYSVSVPNVAAFEYFEMEDGYQYLGVVNGTHLTLGHLAESHGGFAGHSVIPCRHAYSVRRVLASDGNAYLVVGQGHTLAKNKGRVNLYRLSWTGSGLLNSPAQ